MKRDTVLSTRIPEEERHDLEAIARDEGKTSSSIVCSLIENFNRMRRLPCRPSSEVMAAKDLIHVLTDAIEDGHIDPNERIAITRQDSVLQFKLWKFGAKRAKRNVEQRRAAR
jgi:hypothetical protein